MVKQRFHKPSVEGSIPSLTTKHGVVAQFSEHLVGTQDVASVNLAHPTKTIGCPRAADGGLQNL